MRHVQKVTLAGGFVFLTASYYWRPPLVLRNVYLCLASVVVLFATSTSLALVHTLRRRTAQLGLLAVVLHFLAVAGFSLSTMVAVTLWCPLTLQQRICVFATLACVLFIVPWVATEFRVLRRSPFGFDALLPPLFAMLLFQLNVQRPGLEWFLDGYFLKIGVPAGLLTDVAVRVAFRRRWSTLIPVGVSTVALYLFMRATYRLTVE